MRNEKALRREFQASGLETTFLVSLLGFIFVYSVGLILAFTAPMQHELRGSLGDLVQSILHAPDGATLITSLVDVAGYLGLTLFQPLTMIFAYVLVEIWLSGPPKSWARTTRGMFYCAVQTLVNTVLAILIAKLFIAILPGALVTLRATESPNIFVATGMTTLLVLTAMLMQDFGVYWAHRLQHRVRVLWRFDAHYNKNFAVYFTLWDRVFGTCYIPADDEMVDTGIVGTPPAPPLWKYLTARLNDTGEDLIPPDQRG